MCEQSMQRSELQLHTVMSADTSVLTVRQALETAVILGYKALAITDRNSVQSFYSAALYYQQLHTALKLIYGAELANSDGCYTVLVKDTEGLKALYRLISGNEITPREREHLLFGSGNHNGALYGAVANGLNREELIQLAEEYDYIELYVGQGGYTHQEINKKLYALGEKLSIPVVAVGGCHYATADDVFNHSNPVLKAQEWEESARITRYNKAEILEKVPETTYNFIIEDNGNFYLESVSVGK